jgi:hypothetical protein
MEVLDADDRGTGRARSGRTTAEGGKTIAPMASLIRIRICSLALALAAAACSQQATPNLAVALQGIEKSRFLRCSGPPILQLPQGNQERLSFVTNLQRGATIGISSPTAIAPGSCSVDTVFENSRLTSANFSGDQSMCQVVFAPCLRN